MRRMNFTQGIKALSLALLAAAALSSCEKEDEELRTTTLSVYPVLPDNIGIIELSGELVDGAKVSFYHTLEDMLLKQNAFEEVIATNGPAVINVPLSHEPDTLYFSAEYNNLSSDRLTYFFFTTEEQDCDLYNSSGRGSNLSIKFSDHAIAGFSMPKDASGSSYVGFVGLTPTATILQLQVINSLEPVADAQVTLYYSEEDYLNGKPAFQNFDEMRLAYGIYDETTLEYYGDCVVDALSGTTNADGVVYFDQLEPKQYWFKVEKDGLTNASGTFTTGEPLPNNPDITTSLTVGIN